MARGRVDNIHVKEEGKFKAGLNECFRFLYNSDEGTVMGRNGSSWAKIGGFYMLFYSFLAGFFAINLYVMMSTIDPDVPTIVGRTNKPQVAIDEYGSTLLNFGDKEKWNAAMDAQKAIMTRYNSLNVTIDPDANETIPIFRWNDVAEECRDIDAYPYGSDSGCFYLAMNRIYKFNPVEGLDENTRFFFNCTFDIGKSGKGDMSGDITTFQVLPDPSTADFSKYYPWTSVATNGYQPLFAVKIKIDRGALQAIPKDERPGKAFLTCLPYTGVNESTQLPDSRFARLEIKYPWKFEGES